MTDDTAAIKAQLAALTRQVEQLTAAVEDRSAQDEAKPAHAAAPVLLTPGDVAATTFTVPRLLSGYHTPEVDAFMQKAAETIAELTRQRDEAIRQRDALAAGS
ncbi:DivIVA domain-containing protein [Actinomadura hibisca]|uniref:DivIVA domain-containing protein n=1 Tax=Actinomadura hibisca TaxID=68565 RepID=UPI000830A7CC|nr:DivIVA domain-containing protein [Actinomadura hibisca]